ncbi:MAG: hypothetical protein POG74_11220 [Acidocella sp.]|nr:hypothetical protein [Acidocella sp.]
MGTGTGSLTENLTLTVTPSSAVTPPVVVPPVVVPPVVTPPVVTPPVVIPPVVLPGTVSIDAVTLDQGNPVVGPKGGGGTLQLTGGGVFDLSTPDSITNIATINAQEGTGASAQTVYLTDGTKFAVNVQADSNSLTPQTSGIVIYGAENADIITAGVGHDIVYLAGSESLTGGSGVANVHITGDTANNVIGSGSGSINLVVDGGGEVKLGANVTKASSVALSTNTHFTANGLAGLQITGSAAGHDVITLGAASQCVVAGGANETIKASAAFAGASVSGLGANSTLEITSAGNVTLNAATNVALIKMDAPGQLQLNGMQFITANGMVAGDTIMAGGINQTLGSARGHDTLVGFTSGQDFFKGSAAGLNADMIKGFLASDTINVTNLSFTNAVLKTSVSGGVTSLSLFSGGINTHINLAGVFGASGFKLASDGHGGTLITHV